MKKIITLLFIITVLIACKKEIKPVKESIVSEEEAKEEVIPDRSENFPEDIATIFKAHGGIQTFDEMNTLVFEIKKEEGNEKHTTDLKTRYARVESDKFVLGFDGKNAWIKQDSTYFKGNPRFYHNLMFYFYAMPFVLGDEGITYTKVEELKVDNISYPGYKISYGDGIGDSPKDNYFLYYDKDTHKMKYLGYTVTFFSKDVSEKISLIEYSDWNTINDLILPKTLKWRVFEKGVVGDIKSEVNFENTIISIEKKDPIIFSKPVEKKSTVR